jgi:hypothetical protein
MQIRLIGKHQIELLIERISSTLEWSFKQLTEQHTYDDFKKELEQFNFFANYELYLLEQLKNCDFSDLLELK